jgi:hypothetical protein
VPKKPAREFVFVSVTAVLPNPVPLNYLVGSEAFDKKLDNLS